MEERQGRPPPLMYSYIRKIAQPQTPAAPPPDAPVLSHLVTRKAEHSGLVMEGLNNLRCSKQLFDVTLVVEGRKFQAHRVVLAACSEYFCAMFTDAMLESRQQEIELNGVNALGIELLLEYAYTSSIELTRANVQDVLVAASHIQMHDVVDECSKFLELQIDLENCVSIASLAEMFSLDSLKRRTFRYICSRLQEFYDMQDLAELPYDQMENVVMCQYPVNCTEEFVLQMVIEFCVKNQVSGDKIKKLLTHIEYVNIPEEKLRNMMNPKLTKDWKLDARELHQFQRQYREFILHKQNRHHTVRLMNAKSGMQPLVSRSVLQNPRGMELALVKIGGFESNGLTNQINVYLPSKGQWMTLTEIPHIEQCNYGSAVLGNDLYIVGGSYDVCLKEYIHPFGFRYCPLKHLWSSIAPIQTERCRFSLNAVANVFLYAVGGVSEGQDENDNHGDGGNLILGDNATNCECYNSLTDRWEYMPPLPENRSQHSAAVENGILYIGGGLDRNVVLSSFWSFNHYTREWTKLAPMPSPRADHTLIQVDGFIYACGGWCEDPRTENRVLLETIDVYNITTNQWHSDTRNPMPRFYSGIVEANRRIYFIGGLFSKTTLNRATSAVDCYNIDTKKWTFDTQWDYPKEVWECSAVAFYVPRELDDFKYYWAQS